MKDPNLPLANVKAAVAPSATVHFAMVTCWVHGSPQVNWRESATTYRYVEYGHVIY